MADVDELMVLTELREASVKKAKQEQSERNVCDTVPNRLTVPGRLGVPAIGDGAAT